MTEQPLPHLGKLPPQYTFILNPYTDARFSRCPGCGRPTQQRTLPLLVHVEPHYLSLFVHTGRYCPDCNLLIAHREDLEWQMHNHFAGYDPSVIGNDYLVIGAAERRAWREHLRQPRFIDEMLPHVHDFQAVLRLEGSQGRWSLVDDTPATHAKVQGIIDRRTYTLETPHA